MGMLDLALRAIAEPTRREILRLVQDSELPAGQIASRFDVTRPAISQHLRVLSDAGLVTVRRDGTRLFYRARPEGLEELRQYLDSFWAQGLQRLKQAAEQDKERPHGRSGFIE